MQLVAVRLGQHPLGGLPGIGLAPAVSIGVPSERKSVASRFRTSRAGLSEFQEISLANNILERITQVERALERLDEGGYGWCERCGNAIPVERLAAFPSATLCVSCKQLEERR